MAADPPADAAPASDGGDELGGDRVAVARGLVGGHGHERVDVAHRLPAAQRVEHVVLLVGEHPLDLAGGGDDERDERGVARPERRLLDVVDVVARRRVLVGSLRIRFGRRVGAQLAALSEHSPCFSLAAECPTGRQAFKPVSGAAAERFREKNRQTRLTVVMSGASYRVSRDLRQSPGT